MRPDFVSEANTPNLWRLARRGVTFRKHHSIYPSLTNVNAAALATGVNPNRSGVIANRAFRPDLGSGKLARTDSPETIRRSDESSDGKYLGVPTIAELIQSRGGRTAVAGTKTAALLHNRNPIAGKDAPQQPITLFSGETIPPDALRKIVAQLGEFPERSAKPNVAQDAWTTRALTEVLWKENVPEFSVLWLSEPDRSQHATGPGSAVSLAAIKSADANLGAVVRALEKKNVLEKTDILVASDHGFSTIERGVDVAEFLRERDFDVAGRRDVPLARGQIRIATNGGTNLFHIGEHDPPTIARLVETLQQTDFAGVIFSREPAEGAFAMADAHIDTVNGPDVAMAFRWTADRSAAGARGMIVVNGVGGSEKATHGTLSPFDIHNTFVAAGPDFRRAVDSDLPTSNTDVAATIMHILALEPPATLDGRVVTEAMRDREPPAGDAETTTREATRTLAAGKWHQYLRITRVGSSVYIDEGNGSFSPRR